MRIIAGTWKGHSLKAAKGLKTRPTADKVKGAIFNILGSKVQGAEVLDLFAGTGSLSFEALSRGAQNATLVEKDISASGTEFCTFVQSCATACAEFPHNTHSFFHSSSISMVFLCVTIR
jgi:16S rRNA (guanine(966)-N(2))-methyltransferase RsmD